MSANAPSTSGASATPKNTLQGTSRVFVLTPDMLKKLGLADQLKLIQNKIKPENTVQLVKKPAATVKPKLIISSDKVRIIKQKNDDGTRNKVKKDESADKTLKLPQESKKLVETADDKEKKMRKKAVIISKKLVKIPNRVRRGKPIELDNKKVSESSVNSSDKRELLHENEKLSLDDGKSVIADENDVQMNCQSPEKVKLIDKIPHIIEIPNSEDTDKMRTEDSLVLEEVTSQNNVHHVHNDILELSSIVPEEQNTSDKIEFSGVEIPEKFEEIGPTVEDHIESELNRMNLIQFPSELITNDERVEEIKNCDSTCEREKMTDNVDDLLNILGESGDMTIDKSTLPSSQLDIANISAFESKETGLDDELSILEDEKSREIHKDMNDFVNSMDKVEAKTGESSHLETQNKIESSDVEIKDKSVVVSLIDSDETCTKSSKKMNNPMESLQEEDIQKDFIIKNEEIQRNKKLIIKIDEVGEAKASSGEIKDSSDLLPICTPIKDEWMKIEYETSTKSSGEVKHLEESPQQKSTEMNHELVIDEEKSTELSIDSSVKLKTPVKAPVNERIEIKTKKSPESLIESSKNLKTPVKTPVTPVNDPITLKLEKLPESPVTIKDHKQSPTSQKETTQVNDKLLQFQDEKSTDSSVIEIIEKSLETENTKTPKPSTKMRNIRSSKPKPNISRQLSRVRKNNKIETPISKQIDSLSSTSTKFSPSKLDTSTKPSVMIDDSLMPMKNFEIPKESKNSAAQQNDFPPESSHEDTPSIFHEDIKPSSDNQVLNHDSSTSRSINNFDVLMEAVDINLKQENSGINNRLSLPTVKSPDESPINQSINDQSPITQLMNHEDEKISEPKIIDNNDVEPKRKRGLKVDVDRQLSPRKLPRRSSKDHKVPDTEIAEKTPTRTSQRQARPRIFHDYITWPSKAQKFAENHTNATVNLLIKKKSSVRAESISSSTEDDSPRTLIIDESVSESSEIEGEISASSVQKQWSSKVKLDGCVKPVMPIDVHSKKIINLLNNNERSSVTLESLKETDPLTCTLEQSNDEEKEINECSQIMSPGTSKIKIPETLLPLSSSPPSSSLLLPLVVENLESKEISLENSLQLDDKFKVKGADAITPSVDSSSSNNLEKSITVQPRKVVSSKVIKRRTSLRGKGSSKQIDGEEINSKEVVEVKPVKKPSLRRRSQTLKSANEDNSEETKVSELPPKIKTYSRRKSQGPREVSEEEIKATEIIVVKTHRLEHFKFTVGVSKAEENITSEIIQSPVCPETSDVIENLSRELCEKEPEENPVETPPAMSPEFETPEMPSSDSIPSKEIQVSGEKSPDISIEMEIPEEIVKPSETTQVPSTDDLQSSKSIIKHLEPETPAKISLKSAVEETSVVASSEDVNIPVQKKRGRPRRQPPPKEDPTPEESPSPSLDVEIPDFPAEKDIWKSPDISTEREIPEEIVTPSETTQVLSTDDLQSSESIIKCLEPKTPAKISLKSAVEETSVVASSEDVNIPVQKKRGRPRRQPPPQPLVVDPEVNPTTDEASPPPLDTETPDIPQTPPPQLDVEAPDMIQTPPPPPKRRGRKRRSELEKLLPPPVIPYPPAPEESDPPKVLEDVPQDLNASSEDPQTPRPRKPSMRPDETDGKGLSDSENEDSEPLDKPTPSRGRGRGRGRGRRGRGRGRGRGAARPPVDHEYMPRGPPPAPAPAPAPTPVVPPKPPKPQSKTAKCGKCQEEMPSGSWPRHNLSKHNEMAWLAEEPEPDFTDHKFLNRLLSKTKKKKPSLVCESCGEGKKSVAGFISHITFCGKSEAEKQSLMWTCPLCRVILMPSSQEYHERQHRELEIGPENKKIIIPIQPVVDQENCRVKRKAAERAATKISEFTDMVKASDEPPSKKRKVSARIKELIKNPQLTNRIPGVWKSIWARTLNHNEKVYCRQPGCDFGAPTLQAICDHYSLCNFTPRTGFVCKICQFTSDLKSVVIQHVKEQHSSDLNLDDSDYNASGTEVSDEEDGRSEDEDGKPRVRRSHHPRPPSRPKAKFIADAMTYRHTPKEMTFNSTLKWTIDFQNKYYCLDLFENLKLNPFTPVQDPEEFLPKLKVSMQTTLAGKKKKEEEDWKRWDRFEGSAVVGVPTFFTGGPIWALAWLPIPPPLYNKKPIQYLAVSTHPTMNSTYEVGRAYLFKNSIQIWNIGHLGHESAVAPSVPVLSYVVAHEQGTIWCLEWCPSGCYEHESLKNVNSGGEMRRMGLLAAAMSSGVIHIYSLPFPEDLVTAGDNNLNHKIFKTDPVMILHVNSADLRANCQCMTLTWLKTSNHDTLAAGFSNGYVALWDLASKSSLLMSKIESTVHLSSFIHFSAHGHAVMFISITPVEGRRYLATAGMDRCSKMWDLEEISSHFWCLKRGVAVNGTWMTHWPTMLTCYDDVLGLGHTQTYLAAVREGAGKVLPMLPTNSPVFAIASSDWANGICQGTLAGDVVAIFPPQMLYIREIDKLTRRRWLVTNVEVVDFEEKQKVVTKEYDYKPEGYDECQERFGVVFHDDLDNSRGAAWLGQHDRKGFLSAETMPNVPLEQYPFTAINRISWNPNGWSYLWIAVGYRNGLIRILNFRRMNRNSITSDMLAKHAASTRQNEQELNNS